MSNKILFPLNIILILSFCVNLISCCKDKETSPWDSCNNKFTKDMNFRKGIWRRSQVAGILNPQGFNFKNDSIIDILMEINPDLWQYDVKYRMKTCDSFQYNKYWILPQEPNVEYWFTFVSKYAESTGEIEMSYYRNWDRETIKFKKQ